MDNKAKKKEGMVSIIVPIYNTAEYLPRCIESIINQTYKNFELILIDDGSSDNSLEVCTTYAQQDDRIIIIKKENGGQGSARNRGLDIACGEYISFVDSDDYIEPNNLEQLLFNLKKKGADISCGGVYYGKDKSDYIEDAPVLVKNNRDSINLFVRNEYGFNHMPVAKIFRSELFDDVRFLEISGYEDTGTIFKAFINANKVVSQEVSLYYYFLRENSTMRRNFSIKDLDRIVAYKEMEKGLSYYPEYKNAVEVVTSNKIGAIYYVLGEALRLDISQKEHIIKTCQIESKFTLKSGLKISIKNKILLIMICVVPKMFGLLYRGRH